MSDRNAANGGGGARRTGARIVAAAAALAFGAAALHVLGTSPRDETTGLAEAIDGDSLRIAGRELRLKGIDAPELDQTCRVGSRDEPCGRAARAHLRRLLAGGLATCLIEGADRYGRGLARCRARGVDVNAAMVRDGHAVAFGDYQREEAEARAAYRGLWAGAFERPQDWRRRNQPSR